MSAIWFLATKRFDASQGDAWGRYLTWAKLPHLKEVITLDGILSPALIDISAFSPEDWSHSVSEDNFCEFFKDAAYLLEKFSGQWNDVNIIAAEREPTLERRGFVPEAGFLFYGYDVVERGGGVSALTNCRGFDGVFDVTDINERGLISDLMRAQTIRENLFKRYPQEVHADGEIWALWRFESQEESST